MNPTDAALDVLATYRLTKLIVDDGILDAPRHALRHWAMVGGHHKVLEFIGCPWCVSAWCGIGVAGARRFAPRVWSPIALALAASAVTGLIAEAT